MSGGEEGALLGPAIMPGGPPEAWDALAPIFRAIAAKAEDGEPCVDYMGPRGAGHYVKMVHNGIEYGDMQLIAEVYDILHRGAGLPARELADIFADWNDGELKSYLVEITAQIFEREDEETGKPLVDLDPGRGAAEGHWQVDEPERLRRGGADPDGQRRGRSAHPLVAQERARRSPAACCAGPSPEGRGDRGRLVDAARQALYACKITSYAQGMAMLRMASKEYGYGIDPGRVAKIWRAGCIIRASLLGDIRQPSSAIPTWSTCCWTTPFATRSANVRTGGATSCRRRSDWGFRCRRWARRSHTTIHTGRRACRPISRRRSATSSARTPTAASIATARSTRSGPVSPPPDRGATHTDGHRFRSAEIPSEGALDFLSLGALIHRLDPGVIPFRKAMTCAIHVSGGEFNTAANLSDCFGLKTGVATAMVEYPIGELIAGRVRSMGVTPFYKMFKHDGVARPEHGDRLQRSRLRRARPRPSSTTAATRPPPSSSPAISTGTRSSAPACAGSTAAGSSRRSRKRPRS